MCGGACLSRHHAVACAKNLAGAPALRIALSFVANMAFVIVSRTALVTMPIMLAVFGLLHLRWRANLIIFCAALVIAGSPGSPRRSWSGPSRLSRADYQLYRAGRPDIDRRAPGVLAQRAQILCRGPVIGHGTGSTRGFTSGRNRFRLDQGGEGVSQPA